MTLSFAVPRAADHRIAGMIHGAIGMAIFAGSLPATRVAVLGLDAIFITAGRAAGAGILAVILLTATRQKLPARADIIPLLVVAGGVVLGFPLLTALALRSVPAAHTIVFIGLLPLATALFAVLRATEKPRPAFWLWAGAGSAAVCLYALWHSTGGFAAPDLLMLTAVVVCGLGYAEGSRLAKRLGSWQVICWALVLSLPVSLPATLATLPVDTASVALPAWLGFAYVTLFSMFIGFFFWYRGLALGGIARVSQIQLFQPFLGLALAALVLGETVSPDIAVVAVVIGLCVWQARKHA
ncbi:DMT family transporter [Dongia sedimenti]|uniref:DMT family transporter n=1 Tax=Dongia sedimenti TaxID=3064282 RepID=A0ABU0YUF1_9PROT|nr:DMT family transporter [Rhodospirillaceae bacterium R-7]